MSLQSQVKLAMDDAIQRAKDEEEEARMREGLKRHGMEDAELEGVNLAGLRALFGEKCKLAGANDFRSLAMDAKGKFLAERYGSAPRKL